MNVLLKKNMPVERRFGHTATWYRFIEPAVILALLLYFVYLMGAIYNHAYFGKFSFPYEYFNFLGINMISRLIDLLIANIIIIFFIWPLFYLLFLPFGEHAVLDKNFDFKALNRDFHFNLYYYLPKKVALNPYSRNIDLLLFFDLPMFIYIFLTIILKTNDNILNYIDMFDAYIDAPNFNPFPILIIVGIICIFSLIFEFSGKFIIKRYIKLKPNQLELLLPFCILIILIAIYL